MAHEIITPMRDVYIISSGAVAGHEEESGPLGGSFDAVDTNEDRFGEETWERQRVRCSALQ